MDLLRNEKFPRCYFVAHYNFVARYNKNETEVYQFTHMTCIENRYQCYYVYQFTPCHLYALCHKQGVLHKSHIRFDKLPNLHFPLNSLVICEIGGMLTCLNN